MHILDNIARFVGLSSRGEEKGDINLQLKRAMDLPEHEASIVVDLSQCIQGSTIAPTSGLTTATTGTAVTMAMAENLTNCIVNIGTVGGTGTPTMSGQLEENSSTSSTGWTVIPGLTTFTATTASYQKLIGVRTYQYARLNVTTVSGNTPTFPTSAIIIGQAKMSDSSGGYSRLPNAN